jgi:hypothetical protein
MPSLLEKALQEMIEGSLWPISIRVEFGSVVVELSGKAEVKND